MLLKYSDALSAYYALSQTHKQLPRKDFKINHNSGVVRGANYAFRQTQASS